MKKCFIKIIFLIFVSVFYFRFNYAQDVILHSGLVYPKEVVEEVMRIIETIIIVANRGYDQHNIDHANAYDYLIYLCIGEKKKLSHAGFEILTKYDLIDKNREVSWTVKNILKSWIKKKDEYGNILFHEAPYPKSMVSRFKNYWAKPYQG